MVVNPLSLNSASNSATKKGAAIIHSAVTVTTETAVDIAITPAAAAPLAAPAVA
eukprot:CAMPEP_0201487268 /NCGR_PEP_ID=MMETSP0151_2-20130828/12079_1 /ASSEMBLY_ACC=CAM_ASM_000257 /TAXON_ID=200890 /ORGANISM="Paramoeba atlantica, Strain 621/1 / CCAP 1560/9" /LENGTH=53 /DNA_ID=CAMNT_0047872263 /DNA_START=54 /DNA_END=212 /DNA_ORIENTATION=+